MIPTSSRCRRSVTLRASILALAAFAVLAEPASATRVRLDGEGALPGSTCRRLFVVELTYDAAPERPLAMVLDTGASHTVVDPDAIERVFGRTVRHGRRTTLRGGRSGPLLITKQKVLVYELDHLARALTRPVDGILGFDAFQDVLLELDYQAGEARVREGRLPPVDGKTVFDDVGGSRPFLNARLDGELLLALVDSGFGGGLDLKPADVKAWREPLRGISSAVRFRDIVIVEAGRASGDVRVGSLLLPDPVVRASDGTRLIGARVMQHAVWTFDAKRKRIRIDPTDGTTVEMPALIGTGFASRPGRGGLEITRVFPGTAAEAAGFEPGDVIVTWRGRSIFDRECNPIVPDEDGARVPIVIERAGERIETELGAGVLVP